MNAYPTRLVAGACAIALMGLASSYGQSPGSDDAVEQRLSQLEQSLAELDTLLHVRTDTVGIPDRTNRDFNLETRLTAIERNVQQINNVMLDLQRQVADAYRMANQAQSDAQLAQSLARDAANRIR